MKPESKEKMINPASQDMFQVAAVPVNALSCSRDIALVWFYALQLLWHLSYLLLFQTHLQTARPSGNPKDENPRGSSPDCWRSRDNQCCDWSFCSQSDHWSTAGIVLIHEVQPHPAETTDAVSHPLQWTVQAVSRTWKAPWRSNFPLALNVHNVQCAHFMGITLHY